jgi:hypothetical protein
MDRDAEVIKGLRLQAGACRKMGSPLTAGVLEAAAQDAAAGGPVAGLLAPWAEADLRQVMNDAAPLRLAAAIHDLALSGEAAALTAAYESRDPARAWAAAEPLIAGHRDRLARFMQHEPQTNEVRRCICLLGGFLEVARATGLPLRCFEVAASAGLNLAWDSYFYELTGASWGDRGARVAMDTDWTGPLPPLAAQVTVVERAACDRRPTNLADADQRRRLLAYFWPDQAARMARIRAAIAQAVETGVEVEAADAVAWTQARVAPRRGAATVLYHSVFWTYLTAEAQAHFTAAAEAIGAQAMAEAPFAWLSMEPRADDITTMEVWLRLWPGGEARLIAECHPHGAWVRWQA